MKTTNFEHAKTRGTRKHFKMPTIKTEEYEFSILILPIAPLLIVCDKIHKWNYNRQQWSEEKATKVLDYFLPHVLEYDEEEDCYWFSTSWQYYGRNFAKHAPVGLKTWAKKFGYEIRTFVPTGYEKNGYTKTVECNEWDDYEQWVKFTKN